MNEKVKIKFVSSTRTSYSVEFILSIYLPDHLITSSQSGAAERLLFTEGSFNTADPPQCSPHSQTGMTIKYIIH